MVSRSLAAGIGAVLSAGSMLAPFEASARAGFVVGRATFNHGGDFHRFGGHPFVWFRRVPPVAASGGFAAEFRTPGSESVRHYRRIFGHGLPVTGIGVSFGPFDEPIAAVGAIDRPPGPGAADDSSPEGSDRILVNRGDCRSETRMVASEAGGERPIRITWCRKG
jgi:hypothetical protein